MLKFSIFYNPKDKRWGLQDISRYTAPIPRPLGEVYKLEDCYYVNIEAKTVQVGFARGANRILTEITGVTVGGYDGNK